MIVVKGNKYLVTQIANSEEWIETTCNSVGLGENCVSSFVNEQGNLIAIIFSHDLDKRVKEI